MGLVVEEVVDEEVAVVVEGGEGVDSVHEAVAGVEEEVSVRDAVVAVDAALEEAEVSRGEEDGAPLVEEEAEDDNERFSSFRNEG